MLCNKAIYRVYSDACVVIKPSQFFFPSLYKRLTFFFCMTQSPCLQNPSNITVYITCILQYRNNLKEFHTSSGQNVPVYALVKFGTHLQCKMYEPRA